MRAVAAALARASTRATPPRARERARRGRRFVATRGWTGGGDATPNDAPTREDDDGGAADAGDDWTRVRGGEKGALEAGLYLVATPIGNLEDVTIRALRTLRDADAILAEDTRTTRNLLNAYGIATPLVSYHAHNEARRREGTLRRLANGGALALVSDAGMPTVNDPGADLARAAAEIGVRVVPVPGPSAVLAALAGGGLPTDEFTFIGFPPPKSSARTKRLKSFAKANATLIMFVPPHKLLGTLEDAVKALGNRRCAVCRELTKVHEEFWRGTLDEAREEFERRAPRGEITLLIEGYGDGSASTAASDDESDEDIPSASSVEEALRAMLADGHSPSEASRRVAKDLGVRRRDTYGVAQRLSEEIKR